MRCFFLLGLTPLHLAVIGGHTEVVLTLLDSNIDIDVFSFPTNDTPLSLACSHNRLVCYNFFYSAYKTMS